MHCVHILQMWDPVKILILLSPPTTSACCWNRFQNTNPEPIFNRRNSFHDTICLSIHVGRLREERKWRSDLYLHLNLLMFVFPFPSRIMVNMEKLSFLKRIDFIPTNFSIISCALLLSVCVCISVEISDFLSIPPLQFSRNLLQANNTSMYIRRLL